MKRLHLFLTCFIAFGLLSCFVFLPDWREDPVRLAVGEWRTQSKSMGIHAEVTDRRAEWYGKAWGKCAYEWIQTECEPYRLRFMHGNEAIEANVTFDGSDTAILEPDILDKLPDMARAHIRKQNKLRNRPENEFRIIFVRVKAEQK